LGKHSIKTFDAVSFGCFGCCWISLSIVVEDCYTWQLLLVGIF